MKTKKENIKREIFRLRKLLSKKPGHISMNIYWNKKKKNNIINIKGAPLLKENTLHLIGIIYFSNECLIGQMMLIIDKTGKEISYTNYFDKKKSIEISYSWEKGVQLMTMFINDFSKQ